MMYLYRSVSTHFARWATSDFAAGPRLRATEGEDAKIFPEQSLFAEETLTVQGSPLHPSSKTSGGHRQLRFIFVQKKRRRRCPYHAA